MSGKKATMKSVVKVGSRGKNNTPEDKKLLIELVDELKDIIENKKTDATTTVQKNEAWERLTVKFNDKRPDNPKTVQQLRELYKAMKRCSKANLHNDRIEIYKTGGGVFTPKSTDIDLEVQGLIRDHFEPDDNPYDDSAPLYTQETMVPGELDTSFSADDPTIPGNVPSSPVAEPISGSSAQNASRSCAGPSSASNSLADVGPQTSALSDVVITGPSAAWAGARRSNPQSSMAGEKKRALSTIADTIVERKKTKNDNDKATHIEKLKILEDKAVLVETEKEIRKIDLEMKRMEKENLAIVLQKKLEILEEELLLKRNERKFKELEYKKKLSEYETSTNE